MKKQLLTIFSLAVFGSAMAQTPSPSWSTIQNAAFTQTAAGTRFLDAVDPNVVWVVGYDGAAPSRNYNWYSKTTNGGTNFTAGNIFPDTNTWVISNLEGVDANTAWVSCYKKSVQAQGAVFKTSNGGTNWVNMNSAAMYTNSAAFTNIVTFVTPSVGITMGDPNPGTSNEFEIWRTTDGGNSWSAVPGANIPNPTSGEYGLVNIYCKQGTANIWFGTNKGRIFRSTDAGLTWNVSTLPSTPTASANVNDVAFTDPLNGVAYVYNTSTTPATFEMYKSTDGGVNWTAITPVDPNVGRNDICAIPGTTYFASAGAGTGNNIISYSTDGGTTWTDWGSVSVQYLTIDFVNGTTGWSGGFSDVSVATTGGINKYSGSPITSASPASANFSIPANLCLTGPNATITPNNSSTGNPAPTYSWSATPAGVAFSAPTASAPVITFTANGTYTITLAATNSVSSNSSSQIITVLSCTSPSVTFSVPTGSNCNNVALNFTNTSTGSPTPTFSWSTSPAANVTISPSSTASNAAITFSTPGVYSVTLWASNAQGTAQVTQTVNVNNCAPSPSFALPANTCTGTALTMTNQTTGGATSYSWSCSPSPGSISNATAPNPTITLVNVGTYTITLKATNASGSATSSQTIQVTTCAGINENSILADNVRLYPNPAKDFVNIDLPASYSDSYTFTLTNILGKVIMSEKVPAKDKVSINLSNLTKGIYFLSVEAKGQKTTKKLVVE